MYFLLTFTVLLSKVSSYIRVPVEPRDHVASVVDSAERVAQRCHYDVHKLWSHEVGHSPFVASPVITDVNADGELDIIAVPFTESVSVLSAHNGALLTDTYWPVYFTDRSFHARPVQFDVDGDGMLDILLTSSDGELLFYTASGVHLDQYTFNIPPVYVRLDWFTQVVTISHIAVHEFILDQAPEKEDKAYIPVTPHVLATPTLADVNNDDRIDELAIPVSFYFDSEDSRLVEKLRNEFNLTVDDLEKYLVSAVVILNLTSLEPLHTVHLDLTQVNSAFPGYLMASPTVLDLDSDRGACEIVVATGAGNLHVIESDGTHRKGFPISTNSLNSQILAFDTFDDGSLYLVTVDTSGNVACYNHHGNRIWESEVSGTVVGETRLSDIDGDGKVDIIITTEEGLLHVLDGQSGDSLQGWPLDLQVHVRSNVLLTKLSQHSPRLTDIIILGDDGNLYFISNDQQCKHHISIGESSLVQVLSHDLVSQSEGVELLISTNDGTLICIGQGYRQNWRDGKLTNEERSLTVPSELKTHNDFYYGVNKTWISLADVDTGVRDISNSWFWVQYEIVGRFPVKQQFQVQVFFGSTLLSKSLHDEPGVYSQSVPSWPLPCQGHLTVVLSNQHGQIYTDTKPVRFYHVALSDLQWLLTGPFLALSILTLILHGFPAKDLLPVTIRSKLR